MKNIFKNKNEKGFGIVEAILGVALSAILLTIFVSLLLQSVKVSYANTNELKAKMYLQELVEAAKDLEQSDWDEINNSSCASPPFCYFVIGPGNTWEINSGSELLENELFERSIEIESIPSEDYKKKVTAMIYWNDGYQERNLELETYLYNYNEL